MNVDLTTCDQEPIHQPGSIQPHGVLIACRAPNLEVTHVSDNIAVLFGIAPQDVIGKRIGVVFPADEADDRERTLREEVLDTKPIYLFTVRLRGVPHPFDAIAHRSGNTLFVEFERAVEERSVSAPDLYRSLQGSIARVQQAATVDMLCRTCAESIRQINGFDRVMVYRFDADWNGEVVAEHRRDDLEPFLGLHYPASDIPQQARRLYAKNWLRFISDRDYTPSLIVPESSAETEKPLDLSISVLRSVSPIHLEYLRNMGVQASMSISLLRDGKLWGLIACHHYSPRFVPYDVRTACELLGRMMSLTLRAVEDAEQADYRETAADVTAELLEHIERFDDTAKALIESEPNLLELIDADGAAVVTGSGIVRLGQTPGEAELGRLSHWLRHNAAADVYATEYLREVFGTGLLEGVASGVLAISLSGSNVHQILWFRAEQVRTVDWAGDPAKSVSKGDGVSRLSPRGSFALWKETVQGHSRPWTAEEIDAARRLRDGIVRQLLKRAEQLAAANHDLALASKEHEKALEAERSARAESERLSRMKDDFVATLSHELRTPLNAILGWAQILSEASSTGADLAEGLAVIERNARSQAQMIEDLLDVSRIISGKLRLDLHETHLPEIVDAAVETVRPTALTKQIRIEKFVDPLVGVQTTGDPQRLQQIIWNLLSNAVKFTPRGGKVQVILERVNSHVELSISDTGQGIDPEFLPHVFARFRQADGSASRRHGGLGLGLSIVRNLVELHGGTVRAHSPGLGLGSTFVVSLPVRVVHAPADDQRSHPRVQREPARHDRLDLTGVRVLTLDDDPDARGLLQRMLITSQSDVTVCSTIDEALAAQRQQPFDVVISDIGMPGGDGYDFIRRWRELEVALGRPKTPAVALTAYARADDRRRVILAGFQAHVAKPVESGELLALVASLAGRV